MSTISDLRQAFLAAGFNGPALSRQIPSHGLTLALTQHAPALLDALQDNPKLCGLLKLFVFEYPVGAGEAEHAVAPAAIDELIAAGVLRRSGEAIQAKVRILPHDELLVLSDPQPEDRELAQDLVMGAAISSTILLRGTIRKPARRTLDLCAGGGIQALAAAAHSTAVVALEKNPHALDLGRMAAELNGCANIEFRESDFYSAAEGEQFDLIVSNPPFVISPDSELTFRDGGMGADRVSEYVVRNGPRLLSEGGYLQMICDWANYQGRPWQEHLRTWAESTGCDLLVLRGREMAARDYPGIWLSRAGERSPLDYLAKARKWQAYFREQGIESMRFGLLTLRKRSAADNWFHSMDMPLDQLCASGAFIERMFLAQDFLRATIDDEALLAQHLLLDEGVRYTQQYAASGGEWNLRQAMLTLPGSGLEAVHADRYLAGLCAHLDGTRPLREVLTEMAAALQTGLDSLTPQVLPILRGLIQLGYIGWSTRSNS